MKENFYLLGGETFEFYARGLATEEGIIYRISTPGQGIGFRISSPGQGIIFGISSPGEGIILVRIACMTVSTFFILDSEMSL